MVSLVLFLFSVIATAGGREPSQGFLFECTTPILLILGIPAFERSYNSILDLGKKNRDEKEINLNLRLVLYPIIAVAIIAVMIIIPYSYINTISDLPNLINKDYSQISHASIETLDIDAGPKSPTLLHITTDDGTKLKIIDKAFDRIQFYRDKTSDRMTSDEKYTFFYLPHTGWVMDIVDENNISLLKKR